MADVKPDIDQISIKIKLAEVRPPIIMVASPWKALGLVTHTHPLLTLDFLFLTAHN